MSSGLYTHRTRNAGEIVTDTLYNTAHRNQLNNDVPDQCGALSDDLAEFQTTLDPAPGGVVDQVDSILEEFQQIRFVLADIKTALNGGTPVAWYVPVTLTAAAQKGLGARVFRSTSQSINNNTHTACSFDTTMFDTGVGSTLFFSGGQPTRLTAPVPGLYQINGFVEWANSLGKVAAVYIRINAGKILAVQQFAPDSAATATWQFVSTQYELVANDYVELIVHQLTGGNFTVTYSDFALELLNPTAVVPPPNQFTLTINEIGTGSGTVTSDVGPINCPGTCSAAYDAGTMVTLTATPSVGGFVEWTGDIPGSPVSTNPVTVTMDQARTISARFTAYTLSISEAGTGAGTVVSDIGGISCPGTCSALYAPGDIVQLTATASVGSFVGWTGDLVSSSNPDSITMDSDKTVVANFAMTGVLMSLVSQNISGTSYILPSTLGSVSATLTNVQFKLPIDVTLISLSVTMSAALAGGHTVDVQFNVNGADEAGIVASLVATDVDKQADGSIFVGADTLISVKVTQSGGGGDTVQSLTIVYQPAA